MEKYVVIICLLLLLLIFSTRGRRVPWGDSKEKPAWLLGALLRIESRRDQKALPFTSLEGIAERFEETSNSYELKLNQPGNEVPATAKYVKVRRANPGETLSSIQRWTGRRPMPIEIELPKAGWQPAATLLLAYPPEAYFRRWALPVIWMLFGIVGTAHGSMSLYSDLRIHQFGQPIDAHVRRLLPDGHRVCYEIYVDAEARYYGPHWFGGGEGCVRVSPETWQKIGVQKYLPARYYPKYPQFNRLEPMTARGWWGDSLTFLIGLGSLAAALRFSRAYRPA